MGLTDVAPFDIKEKVIGYTEPKADALISKVTHEFVHEVSRDSPAPGGGSVAALSGALGGALGSMVANLTVGKPGYEAVDEAMVEAAEKAQEMKDKLLEGVDADTEAFNAYIDAIRMPKSTPEEREIREKAMQEGLKQAVYVPLETAKNSLEALKACRAAAEVGNKNSVSDAGVGGHMAFAGLQGAILNVLINLGSIKDEAFIEEMKTTCRKLDREGRTVLDEVMGHVNDRLDHTL
jgi:glutamate formiminotransferase/formiminotetrahydrofolate cyclodeaminase